MLLCADGKRKTTTTFARCDSLAVPTSNFEGLEAPSGKGVTELNNHTIVFWSQPLQQYFKLITGQSIVRESTNRASHLVAAAAAEIGAKTPIRCRDEGSGSDAARQ